MMETLFRKSIEKKQIILFIICLLIFPSMIQNKEKTNLLFVLFSSNYVALILNNIYIWVMFTRVAKINAMFDKIITRYSKEEFVKKYILYSILSSALYLLILYLTIYSIVGLESVYYQKIVCYFFTQIIYFTFLELFCMLSLESSQEVSQDGKMILPIFINLIYHYVFVIGILVKIFVGG